MAVVRAAYRAIARNLKGFEAQRIPLTGVVNLARATESLSPLGVLQLAFQSPEQNLDGTLPRHILHRLPVVNPTCIAD